MLVHALDRRAVTTDRAEVPRAYDLAGFTIAIIYFGLVCKQIDALAFNWPQGDDFAAVQWYRRYQHLRLTSLFDMFQMHDGSHPIGLQIFLSLIVFKLAGLNFKTLVWFNSSIVLLAATIIWAYARGLFSTRVVRVLAPLLIVALFFHPIQTNHLIWSFEMGWFLVNLALILNIVILERHRYDGIPAVIIILILGSFCSAQGVVLWICALMHVCLFPQYRFRSIAIALITIGLFIDTVTIIRISPDDNNSSLLSNLPALVIYVVSIFGSISGSRDHSTLIYSGCFVIATAAAIVLASVRSRDFGPLERIKIVLAIGSVCYIGLFTKGRYSNGLEWALDMFHFAPLLIPLMVAIGLAGLQLLDTRPAVLKQLAGALIMVLMLGTIGSAIPYMRQRGSERTTKAAFSMHVLCNSGFSKYVIANANLNLRWFPIIEEVKDSLMPLCTPIEPASARMLEVMPALFAQLSAADPGVKHALSALWDVYTVHFDLQRAFGPTDSDLLLRFARGNAQTGSKYESEILGPYSDVYTRLGASKE